MKKFIMFMLVAVMTVFVLFSACTKDKVKEEATAEPVATDVVEVPTDEIPEEAATEEVPVETEDGVDA